MRLEKIVQSIRRMSAGHSGKRPGHVKEGLYVYLVNDPSIQRRGCYRL